LRFGGGNSIDDYWLHTFMLTVALILLRLSVESLRSPKAQNNLNVLQIISFIYKTVVPHE